MCKGDAAPPLRILCFDGGGVRGFNTVAILKLIEEQVGPDWMQRYDLICGTSVGGIFAAFLSFGWADAEELEKVLVSTH